MYRMDIPTKRCSRKRTNRGCCNDIFVGRLGLGFLPFPPVINSIPDLTVPGPPYVAWLRVGHGIEENAVAVDDTPERNKVYVGRGYYNGLLLPATLLPGNYVTPYPSCDLIISAKATTSWMGKEVRVKECEVLVVQRAQCEWVAACDGDVPAHALPVGATADGHAIFAARGFIGSAVVFGRVVTEDGVCVAPYCGKEVALKNYEVLTIM